MKKIYTIGRDGGCDIVIPDNTDVISRLHATIRVESNDKIYLTDQSRNGTYINGMKMSSNVENAERGSEGLHGVNVVRKKSYGDV